MRSEIAIREMLALVRAFGTPDNVRVLEWVLGEYPPKPTVERTQADSSTAPTEAKPKHHFIGPTEIPCQRCGEPFKDLVHWDEKGGLL